MKKNMKMLILIYSLTLAMLTGCSNFIENSVELNKNNEKSAVVINDESLQTDEYNEANKIEKIVDYSPFTGEWVCKDTSTSINIKVDSFGIIEGNITSVVGIKVPSSFFTGTIENNKLETSLLDGEGENVTNVGTLVLDFSDLKVIKGTVELDKSIATYLELAEGEMLFLKN